MASICKSNSDRPSKITKQTTFLPLAQHHKELAVGQSQSKLLRCKVQCRNQVGSSITMRRNTYLELWIAKMNGVGRTPYNNRYLMADKVRTTNQMNNKKQYQWGIWTATRHPHRRQQWILKQARHRTNLQCNQGQPTVLVAHSCRNPPDSCVFRSCGIFFTGITIPVPP
jgi:hypothetical protein